MNAKEYQTYLKNKLIEKFPQLDINEEWRAFSGLGYQYCPRVDVAIGPFSTQPGETKIIDYNRLLRDANIDFFLKKVYNIHLQNIGDEWMNEIIIPEYDLLIRKNQNARCLIALEIENTSTKKHIMGSLVNSASLGRIGIGVAFNESVMRTFLRIMNYLAFLKRVEKNTYDTTNFLIITKEQLRNLLEE